MIYRVFVKSQSGTYKLRSGKEDIEIRGKVTSAENIAIKWASKYAGPEEVELDLMVAQFAVARVENLRRVVVRRTATPWAVVVNPDGDELYDQPY